MIFNTWFCDKRQALLHAKWPASIWHQSDPVSIREGFVWMCAGFQNRRFFRERYFQKTVSFFPESNWWRHITHRLKNIVSLSRFKTHKKKTTPLLQHCETEACGDLGAILLHCAWKADHRGRVKGGLVRFGIAAEFRRKGDAEWNKAEAWHWESRAWDLEHVPHPHL